LENKKKVTLILAGILLLVELIIITLSIINKRTDAIPEAIIIAICYIIYVFIEIKYELYVGTYIKLTVIITLIAHTLFGNYIGLYDKSFVFDKILHLYGTYSFALFSYGLLCYSVKELSCLNIYRFIFIISLGIALGSLFETIEFLGDILFNPKRPYQNNLLDTNLDLIFNTIGALIAGLHLIYRNVQLKYISKDK
jgi:hypothetical protein